jgi:ATP-dependent Lon protease
MMHSISSSYHESLSSFEEKAQEHFGEVLIRKSLVHDAGFGARTIPTYVGEWVLSRYVEDGDLNDASRAQVAQFIAKYLPPKGYKDAVKETLLKQLPIRLLDDYSVSVNLKTGTRSLRIPFLDIQDAMLDDILVEKHPMLLTSGVWGIGELSYIPPDGKNRKKGEVWMHAFKPFQVGGLDLAYYIECRRYFTLDEWRALLVCSMGFNPTQYDERQKTLLLTRILPFVEPKVNLVEIAPKGTGKSFIYDNLSRYARVVSGGKVSPAVLFHNQVTNVNGLVTHYDVIVFDEVQSIRGDTTGDLIAGLKVYLESGKFSRGNTEATADAGFVMLGNLSADARIESVLERKNLFHGIPNFLQETAFIDRMHGILPGWELPRVSKKTPAQQFGFKGDFFAEVLHRLRGDTSFSSFVKMNIKLYDNHDLRDRKAITRLASAYLKLLFPDLHLSPHEFRLYCVEPAIEMRERVRHELQQLDAEYRVAEYRTNGIISETDELE